MIPEEERALANRIIRDLLSLEGFIRTLEIIFLDDEYISFGWNVWVEEESMRSPSSKTFYHVRHVHETRTGRWIRNYVQSIATIDSIIRRSCSVRSVDANMLKEQRSLATFITLPRLSGWNEIPYATESRVVYP